MKNDISAATTVLEITLGILETNAPINRAEGNIEQAQLEEKNAESIRAGLEVLNNYLAN